MSQNPDGLVCLHVNALLQENSDKRMFFCLTCRAMIPGSIENCRRVLAELEEPGVLYGKRMDTLK
jgi:hypothetical protein